MQSRLLLIILGRCQFNFHTNKFHSFSFNDNCELKHVHTCARPIHQAQLSPTAEACQSALHAKSCKKAFQSSLQAPIEYSRYLMMFQSQNVTEHENGSLIVIKSPSLKGNPWILFVMTSWIHFSSVTMVMATIGGCERCSQEYNLINFFLQKPHLEEIQPLFYTHK